MSIADHIRSNIKEGETYRPRDFYAYGGVKGVHQAMSRLADAGEMERVGRGQYRAASQQPARAGKEDSLRLQKIAAAQEFLKSRSEFLNRIGIGFDGLRDNWKALGYTRKLTFQDYFQAYKRGDIAQRIVDAPAKATWRNPPQVMDESGEDGDFAQSWLRLVERLSLFRELERADIRARIGNFGIMLLGFRGQMTTPVRRGQEVLYVSSYHQDKVSISDYVTNTADPRFGRPLTYRINMRGSLNEMSLQDRDVHWTRTVHIAEDPIEDDIFGKPALEAVFNKLFDMEKVVGGAAESVWKTFDRGLLVSLDADANLDEESVNDLDDNIEKYVHGLQRVIKGQGLDVSTLGAEAADPRGHFQVLASIISGTTGIPQRILFGSERGQLASSMDERNWNSRIRERQVSFAEPNILRPFIQRMIRAGELPEPEGRLRIHWPDLMSLSETEKLENAKLQAQAIRNVADKDAGIDFMTREEKRRITLPQFDPELPQELKGEQAASNDDASEGDSVQ